ETESAELYQTAARLYALARQEADLPAEVVRKYTHIANEHTQEALRLGLNPRLAQNDRFLRDPVKNGDIQIPNRERAGTTPSPRPVAHFVDPIQLADFAN